MHDGVTTVRYTVHVETALEHPAARVWPHILRWDAWIEDYREERVGGEPDSVGEVLRVSHFDETGRLDLSFFVSIFKIAPPRQLVYKIASPLYSYDPETGASTAAPTMGFEILNLREEGDGTIVSLDAFIESQPAGVTADQVKEIEEGYSSSTGATWTTKYYPALAELLAKES